MKKFLVFLFPILLSSFLVSDSYALNFSGGVPLTYTSASSVLDINARPYANFGLSGNRLFKDFGTAINDMWGFDLVTAETIPGGSLVSFTISFSSSVNNDNVAVAGPTKYDGIQFENGRTLIYDSCMQTAVNYPQYNNFECSYVFYNPYDTHNIQTKGATKIWELMHGQPNVNHNMVIGPASAIILSTRGLNDNDRQFLEDMFAGADSAGVVAKLEQVKSEQMTTNSLLQTQNEQQQEQYESEKAEEADREDSASDDISSLNSSFSFEITDPLSYIFDSFTSNNNCVSIPTIAGLLNSSETSYCPWFSSSVRNTLTPVFSTFVTVLCYGFLVSWLRKGDN